MRNIEKQQEWLKKESKTPSQSWYNLCQSLSRQSVSLPPVGSTAANAWDATKKKFRVDCPNPNDKEWWASIPRGAIIYSTYRGSSGTGAGHAWVCADAGESAWSNDAKRHGKVDKVHIMPKKWGWNSIHNGTAGYIIGHQAYEGDGFFKGLTMNKWDGHVPPYDPNAIKAFTEDVANKCAYRIACRLIDLGMGDWNPVPYEQKFPTKAYARWCEANGTDPNVYSEADHAALFA